MTVRKFFEPDPAPFLSEACKECREPIGSDNPDCVLHRFRAATIEMEEHLNKLRGIMFASDEDCVLAATLLLSEVEEGAMVESGDSGVLKTSLDRISNLVRKIKKGVVQ